MGVSLYYSVSQPKPFSRDQRRELENIMEQANAHFPADSELLDFWDDDDSETPTLSGSTKLPLGDQEQLTTIWHALSGVTQMRRHLPDGEWSFHLEDVDIDWDDEDGYTLPGLDSPEGLDELEGH